MNRRSHPGIHRMSCPFPCTPKGTGLHRSPLPYGTYQRFTHLLSETVLRTTPFLSETVGHALRYITKWWGDAFPTTCIFNASSGVHMHDARYTPDAPHYPTVRTRCTGRDRSLAQYPRTLRCGVVVRRCRCKEDVQPPPSDVSLIFSVKRCSTPLRFLVKRWGMPCGAIVTLQCIEEVKRWGATFHFVDALQHHTTLYVLRCTALRECISLRRTVH